MNLRPSLATIQQVWDALRDSYMVDRDTMRLPLDALVRSTPAWLAEAGFPMTEHKAVMTRLRNALPHPLALAVTAQSPSSFESPEPSHVILRHR